MVLDPLNDGISRVELIDRLGDDLTIVNAARVSLGKSHNTFQENDIRLLGYLAKHNHWTPFGHPQIEFRIKMPIFVAREWYRHTIGFVRNEVSRRYVDDPPELYIPAAGAWRMRSNTKKQGSSKEIIEETGDLEFYGRRRQDDALLAYGHLLEIGVAPEMARMVLPQSMYTEFIETASLYAYARLCGLRISADSQQETRVYAEAISGILGILFPHSWAALTKGQQHE